MKKTLLTSTTLLLLASVAFASAQGRGGHMFDFETIDTDGNGEITQAEITAFEAARFAEADANGDGLLSKEELVAQIEARSNDARAERLERGVDRMMSHLDADEDGSISLEERQSNERSAKMFDRLDADDSGTISEQEAEKMSDRGGRGDKKGKKGKTRG